MAITKLNRYSLPTTLDLSAKTLTLPSASVTAHVTQTDLTPVRQDVLTLALKQATQENSTKFNLANSAITKFEADADFNLAGSTTVARNASEYIRAQSTSSSSSNFIPQHIRVSTLSGVPANSSHTGDNGTNDMIPNGIAHSGGYNYCMTGINEAWDLSGDFKFRAWIHTLSYGAGNLSSMNFFASSLLLTDDTSITAGSTPSGVFATAGAPGLFNGTATHWSGNVLDSSYASTAGITSSTSDTNFQYTDSSAAQSVSAGSANKIVRGYWNGGESTLYSGWEIEHTSSTNTILMRVYDAGSSTAISSHMPITITNVPSSGRAYILLGHAFGQARYYSTSKAGGSTSSGDNSQKTTNVITVPATGTALGTTNVPTSAVTDVSGVMLLKNAYGTNTLGTDVKVYFTANNSAWTEAASYTDAGTFSTGIKMIKLGKTTCTEGSDVRWKVVWANQAASSKEAHIYGIGVNY